MTFFPSQSLSSTVEASTALALLDDNSVTDCSRIVDRSVWVFNQSLKCSNSLELLVALFLKQQSRNSWLLSGGGGNKLVISQRGVWKALWGLNSLKHPNKVKIFMWRACCGFLPCAAALFYRKIGSSACCGSCGFREETANHVATVAKDCWLFMEADL